MAKRYARLNWQNKPSVATPINATNLNKMDKGIDDIDTALNNLENSIVGQIVNDPTKINNAAVNYSLKQSIDTINKNLQFFKIIRVDNDSGLPDNPSEIGREIAYIIIKMGGAGMFIGYEANTNYGIQLNLSYFNGIRYRIKNNSLTFGEWVQL